jgi:uncharacterized OB-fold protein
MNLGLVARDDATAEFLDAAARGEFLIQRCAACSRHSGPQAQQCHACGATELSWIPAAGEASIVSWTIAHGRPAADGSVATTVLAIAELAEGPWWWSQIVEIADPGQLTAGLSLRISFEQPDGSEPIPVFRLAAGAA